MGKGTVHVRPATAADAPDIFAWRNDPLTRAASANTNEVAWGAHASWFAGVLDDPARHLLVGWMRGGPGDLIGMVRFDGLGSPVTIARSNCPRSEPSARRPPLTTERPDNVLMSSLLAYTEGGPRFAYELSINVAPHARNRRLAVPLLNASAGWLHKRVGDAVVVARTRVTNNAAQRACSRAGYREIMRDEDGWVHLVAQISIKP